MEVPDSESTMVEWWNGSGFISKKLNYHLNVHIFWKNTYIYILYIHQNKFKKTYENAQ